MGIIEEGNNLSIRFTHRILRGDTLSSEHRVMKKNFETELWIDKHKLPLNHFVQETLANVMLGFLKTLKETDESPTEIEVKIRKLVKQIDVDAHTYP